MGHRDLRETLANFCLVGETVIKAAEIILGKQISFDENLFGFIKLSFNLKKHEYQKFYFNKKNSLLLFTTSMAEQASLYPMSLNRTVLQAVVIW